MSELPKLNWVKYDRKEHQAWYDGTRVLIALQVTNNKTNKTQWEFDIVNVTADEDWLALNYDGGEPYDAWAIDDIEYFAILSGRMPERGDNQ
jgi:hypothetical protein